MDAKLLGIYLNDHLAGSAGLLDLANRAATENDGTAYGVFLRGLVEAVEQDRRSLLALMERLDVQPTGWKQAAARLAEKVGRLKTNGQLTGYSPLSRLEELEAIGIGIEGKRALWSALRELAEGLAGMDAAELSLLEERASNQRQELEKFRLQAAREALL